MSLPASAKYVIVGAGIHGLSTATSPEVLGPATTSS